MNLKEFARTFDTTGVKFRGKDLILTRLSAALTMAVSEAFPTPRAPLFKNPLKGSLADPEPDYEDPKYKTELRSVFKKREAATIALAVGLEVTGVGKAPPAGESGFKVWCEKAAAEIMADLDDAEMIALSGQAHGGASVEEALKN